MPDLHQLHRYLHFFIISKTGKMFSLSALFSFESSAFLNLGYHHYRDLGAGEIVFITPERIEVLQKPREKMKICSFLWVGIA